MCVRVCDQYIDQIVSIRTHSSLIACFELRTSCIWSWIKSVMFRMQTGGSFLVPRHEMRDKRSGKEWENEKREIRCEIHVQTYNRLHFSPFLFPSICQPEASRWCDYCYYCCDWCCWCCCFRCCCTVVFVVVVLNLYCYLLLILFSKDCAVNLCSWVKTCWLRRWWRRFPPAS